MSLSERTVNPVTSGRVVEIGSSPKAVRVQLDYASWYARLAAPGSTIVLPQPATRPIVRLAAASHMGDSAAVERRTA
jgi:hypothetical protein